jgi:hypothetical protein
MAILTFLPLLPGLLALAASVAAPDGGEVRALVAQDGVILRVPVRPTPPQPIEWVERDGPECVPTAAIRGAALSHANHVDFILAGRRRMRAELAQDCPGLDFYTGFYLTPEDDQLCAGRDSIRSRIGGSCRIERFHRLLPRLRPVP